MFVPIATGTVEIGAEQRDEGILVEKERLTTAARAIAAIFPWGWCYTGREKGRKKT